MLTDLSAAASIAMSFRLSGFATGQANTHPGQNHPEPLLRRDMSLVGRAPRRRGSIPNDQDLSDGSRPMVALEALVVCTDPSVLANMGPH